VGGSIVSNDPELSASNILTRSFLLRPYVPVEEWRTWNMRLIVLPILSYLNIVFLAGCVQSDEEYFRHLEREGIYQEQRNRQLSPPSYGLEEFQREKEEAGREH
jgi:hypothetical protein